MQRSWWPHHPCHWHVLVWFSLTEAHGPQHHPSVPVLFCPCLRLKQKPGVNVTSLTSFSSISLYLRLIKQWCPTSLHGFCDVPVRLRGWAGAWLRAGEASQISWKVSIKATLERARNHWAGAITGCRSNLLPAPCNPQAVISPQASPRQSIQSVFPPPHCAHEDTA